MSNVPTFEPSEEIKLYIPSKRDEVILTRDWTFIAYRRLASNLFHALGLTVKQQNRHTYKGYDGSEKSYVRVENVLVDGTGDKMQITLVAGCILALDSLENDCATMRVTYAPKEQKFINKRLRPRFTVDICEVNNKLFCLPATEPDVNFEESGTK